MSNNNIIIKNPSEDKLHFELPRRKDYFWEKEENIIKQRELREGLRYKHYVRTNSISHLMHKINTFVDAVVEWIKK